MIRALLAALMLGFPLVLVLAWFFEWTPAGLVADGAEPPASAIRLRTRRKLDLAIAVLVIAALGYLAATWEWRSPIQTPRRPSRWRPRRWQCFPSSRSLPRRATRRSSSE